VSLKAENKQTKTTRAEAKERNNDQTLQRNGKLRGHPLTGRRNRSDGSAAFIREKDREKKGKGITNSTCKGADKAAWWTTNKKP
jgi:hypothetical protein